ncbi:MAG: tRNA 2-thiouridine(34) synthase MnmA [Nitrospiraceae bacterium]|nr:tRNA 2-thiouridine(34) synthase MnmA [Nitrospiraceae bacterium]
MQFPIGVPLNVSRFAVSGTPGVNIGNMKVLVGMSGGVDSSVSAYILKQQGFEVEGVSLLLFETRGRKDPRSCCSLETVAEAGRTAEAIGIPHKVINARDLFMERVIGPFAGAYAQGLTPNPCILCNRHVKFPILLAEAEKCGADFIATGHYARVGREGGETALKRGADQGKDQSYVLYMLRKDELERLLLPLGGLRKTEVRQMAREAGLPVFNKPESQEICFVDGKDYLPLVRALEPGSAASGPVLDSSGVRIGTHKGLYAYTIGQRKGLGVSRPEPLYVYRIDPGENTVYVGPREKALIRRFEAGGLNWLMSGYEGRDFLFRAEVKVRSMMRASPARVWSEGKDAVHVEFDSPQWAPAPGQSAVFYEGERVAGGGTIKKIFYPI